MFLTTNEVNQKWIAEHLSPQPLRPPLASPLTQSFQNSLKEKKLWTRRLNPSGSPFPPLDPKYPDLPVGKWYEYGFKEGVPRLLDMWDRVGVKVTSHMVGQAVERHPELAKEIVDRGHEASGHGQTWEPEYSMTPEQERAGYQASIDTIQRVTGTRPVGFNAFWLRGTPNTLEILQELGFIYHIDDISRDEPFTVTVKGKPFAVVPYTIRNKHGVGLFRMIVGDGRVLAVVNPRLGKVFEDTNWFLSVRSIAKRSGLAVRRSETYLELTFRGHRLFQILNYRRPA